MDANTVQALFTHRLHVLRDYRRQVLHPVICELVREERKSARSRGVSRLLIRHPQLLDEPARHRVADLLDRHVALRTIIGFRDRLQQVWDHTSATHDSTLTVAGAAGAGQDESDSRTQSLALRLPKYALSER